MKGVRRALDRAADRALSAGPPSRRTEARAALAWSGLVLAAVSLPLVGRRLSR